MFDIVNLKNFKKIFVQIFFLECFESERYRTLVPLFLSNFSRDCDIGGTRE